MPDPAGMLRRTSSRTDRILAVMRAAIERYRQLLDSDATLHAIQIIVTLRAGGGQPQRVIVRPEFQDDAGHLAQRDEYTGSQLPHG